MALLYTKIRVFAEKKEGDFGNVKIGKCGNVKLGAVVQSGVRTRTTRKTGTKGRTGTKGVFQGIKYFGLGYKT